MATVAVMAIATLFVNLGLWQLDRHRERVLENQIKQQRLASDVTALSILLDAVGDDLGSLEYRRTSVSGVFDPDREVLLRGQVESGSPGFDVITPLLLDDGTTLLVDRGWVPLAFDTPPVLEGAPPVGRVEVEGILRLTQQPSAIGPTEPPGGLTQIARVDLDRLSQQFTPLVPVWLEITEDDPPAGPLRRGPAPDVSDDGPHLEYAVQWFAFALVGIVGFGLVIRRAASRVAEQ
jgi:surfeit locus 1 family protein